MTVTYSSVEPELRIQSTFINSIIASETGFTVSLEVVVNGASGGNSVSFEDIVVGDLDVPNARFELTAADLNLTEFINGVYSFKLTKELTNGSKEYQSYCLFVNIDFTCDVIDAIAASVEDQDKVIMTIGMLNLLNNIHTCEECNCTNAVTIWNEINYQLDLETRQDDCGCN